MLDSVIRLALKQRIAVLLLALILMSLGIYQTSRLPVDVFPDLNRPTVTVMTEAHGLAPEEVELQVTLPIETALNGLPQLIRLRSQSGPGLSVVYAEFDWDTELFKNRQLVSERLQLVQEKIPRGMFPTMTPSSSIMGEIMFVGVTSPTQTQNPMELRTLADWTIRPRLLAIPGVSQVITMGGELKQYQIVVSAEKLHAKGLTLENLKQALAEIGMNTTGGHIEREEKEFLIRTLGRIETAQDIADAYVGLHFGRPVKVKDIAEVKIGHPLKRGNSTVNAKPAVVLTIQKQPQMETLKLTRAIDQELMRLKEVLPQGVVLETDLFKQAHFIENAIENVIEALRDGTLMVMLVLMLFLLNWRTTFITLTAIPLSLLMSALIFKFMGIGVNTMTLGGLAVAIGELVDDAIVDVENVFRRLKENRLSANPRPTLKIVYAASSEIRNSIVFSTFIVVLVFLPLFALDGLEGKLFVPMGQAYIISILASLFVSLTVTPVLCYYLLPASIAKKTNDGFFVIWLKGLVAKIIPTCLNYPRTILTTLALLFLITLTSTAYLGQNFLPNFNEGSATIGLAAQPGISLTESDTQGRQVEEVLLSIPEIKSTVRRVGRAEMDEHAEGVHWNEIDVDFKTQGRPREIVLQEMREKIAQAWPEVYVNIGQPISHRLDHMLSGARAQIVLKVFGPDLAELRRVGGEIQQNLKDIPGLVDLQVEPLVQIPQLKIFIDKELVADARMSAGSLARDLEDLLQGANVGQMVENERLINITLRLDDKTRSDPELIEGLPIKQLPTGEKVLLKNVANVYEGSGPNMINRENLQRRLYLTANSAGVDLQKLVNQISDRIHKIELSAKQHIEIAGQFEGQIRSTRKMLWLGLISLIGIFLVLFFHFNSAILSFQIMLNVPLALIGSIIALWLTEKSFSLASLIAFVTLCGIATRNGIMMISHYLHLLEFEGEKFDLKMIIRGTQERLVPVLMTALTAILALMPLLFAKGEPGKEILHPVAIVITGGLLSSTFLDLIVTPLVFFRFGEKAAFKYLNKHPSKDEL